MDRNTREQWEHEALDIVWASIAASGTLAGRLVFKGARVLNRRLGDTSRQSLDLDANLRETLLTEYPDAAQRAQVLQHELSLAIEHYLAGRPQTPYSLEHVVVEQHPASGIHPFGWDGMKARIRLRDARHAAVTGLPALEIDFSSPEAMGDDGVAPLLVDSGTVQAETLERIAGEKMRAFLQSLPTWRNKTGSDRRAARVRDLYDLMRVSVARPLVEHAFWDAVARQFRLACASRSVDCHGISTFAEQLGVTRASYETDATIPKRWTFDEVWTNLTAIVAHAERAGVIPCSFPLPKA